MQHRIISLARSFTTIKNKRRIVILAATRLKMKATDAGGDLKPVTFKLETEELKAIYTPELKTLSDVFKKNGHELRLAGGAVRDLLMGQVPHDLDFATTATPEEMKEMFIKENIRMINAKGEKHGTITPRIHDKQNFEVTTLRIDVATDGRHAEVEFTRNWQLDANRRDLTINSLFMDLDGVIYDYFNGIQDIKSEKIRFVGNAETRIREDYLRILRYFRFFGRIATFSADHDEKTLIAIKNEAQGLANISGERLWCEFKKILEGPMGGELVLIMSDCNILPYLGITATLDKKGFLSVWANLIQRKYHAVTLMSALINNVEEACKLQGRLKMSAFERDLLMFLLEHRDQNFQHAIQLLPYQKLIVTSKFKMNDVKLWCVELLKMTNKHELAEELEKWTPPRFPINGDMIRAAGCPRGKILGQVINKLKIKWVESNFELSSQQLLEMCPIVIKTIEHEMKMDSDSSNTSVKRKAKDLI